MITKEDNIKKIEEGQIEEAETRKALINNGADKVSEKQPGWNDALPQIGYCCLAMLVALQSGMSTGFSAVFLPQLMADPNFKYFNTAEASWIASLGVLSGPLGGLSIGPFMDRFGRKSACILANVPPILCWALTYMVSESLWPLYLARFISGCGGGMLPAVNVFVAEICHPVYRPMLMFFVGVFVSTGTMIITLLAAISHWHTASGILLLTAIGSLLASLLLPESPIWLVTFNPNLKRLKKAEKQIDKISRAPWLQELERAKLLKIYHRNEKGIKSTQSMTTNSCYREFKKFHLFHDRAVYYPIILVVIIFLFQEISGIFIILFYSRNLFLGLGGNFGMGLDEYTATVSVGAIRLMMSVIMAYVSMHIGRRKLLLISSLGMGGTILISGILQIHSQHTMNFTKEPSPKLLDSEGIAGLITVICILLYVMFATVGVLSIPWALISELLPSRARGIGNSIIMTWAFLLLFFVLKGVPYLLEVISLATLFFLLAAFCLGCAVFVYFYLPETFKKSLHELEIMFENKTQMKK